MLWIRKTSVRFCRTIVSSPTPTASVQSALMGITLTQTKNAIFFLPTVLTPAKMASVQNAKRTSNSSMENARFKSPLVSPTPIALNKTTRANARNAEISTL
jgi:hypothetical protein